MSEKVTAMIEEIKALSVLELAELVHAIEDAFGVSAAAVAAVVIGAAAALMTSSTPEKIDLSTTHTTEAPSESAKEPETTSAPETTAPETTASSTASVTSSLETYTSGNISIQYPQVSGLSDSKLQDSINENLKNNALSVITGYEADEAKDSMTVT